MQLSLLFVIVMIPLNYTQRKCTGGSKFTKSQKINYRMYMDDFKLFEKKELETLIQTYGYTIRI